MPSTTSRSGSRNRSTSSSRQAPASSAQSYSRKTREYLDKYGEGLSKSTLRAKWIESNQDKPDRAGQTLATRSPDVIKRWAEEREARPVTAGRRSEKEDPRVLRFAFGNEKNERLEDID